MNNQPTIEAFNSFYRQGMELYKAGQLSDARAALLKAAELANKISVGSTSYEVRMEYHNAAVKLLDFAKNGCRPAPERIHAAPLQKTRERAVTEPVGRNNFAALHGFAVRFVDLEILGMPEVLKNFSVKISRRNFHGIYSP